MKKKSIIFISLTSCLILLTAALYFSNLNTVGPKPIVKSIDNKGIFIGEQKDLVIKPSQYSREIQADDEAHEHLRAGNLLFQQNKLNEAVEEYRKSYLIGGMSKIVSGFTLIETYEKLDRYDEALSLLDEIEKPSWSEYGHQKAAIIRTRLLAAKEQVEITKNAQS